MNSSEKGDVAFAQPKKEGIEHIVILSQEESTNDRLRQLCQETWGEGVTLDFFNSTEEALLALAGKVGVRADAIILDSRLPEEDSAPFITTLTEAGGIHATVAVIAEGDFDRQVIMLEKGVLQILPENATPMQLMKAVCSATKTCLLRRREQEEIKRSKVLNTLSRIESDKNLSLEQKFQAILETLLALKSFGIADEGSIALYDRGKDELAIVAEQKLSSLVQAQCRDTPRKPLQRLRSGQSLCICDWVALLGKHITVGSTQETITIPKEVFHNLFKPHATKEFPVPVITLPNGIREEGDNYVIVAHEGVQTPKKHGHINHPIKLNDVVEGVLNLYTVEGKEETQDEESFFTFVTSVLERLLQRDRIEKELAKTEWAEARRLIIAEHASQPVFMLDATDENGRIIPSNVLARALLVKMSPFGDDPNIPALPLEALFFEPDKIPMKTMQSADEATYEIIDHVAVNQHIKDHFVDKTIEKRINGNVFTVEAKRITDESLGIDAIGIYLNDITEQKKGEALLARAQEIAHLGNWRWQITGGDANNIFWSDEIYRIFGLEPRTINPTYRSFLGMVHPDDRPLVKRAITHAIRNGTPYEIEHRVVRPDGEIKWVRESGVVEKDKDGKSLYMDGTVQDITPMKEILASLENSVDNLELLLKNTTAAIRLVRFIPFSEEEHGELPRAELYREIEFVPTIEMVSAGMQKLLDTKESLIGVPIFDPKFVDLEEAKKIAALIKSRHPSVSSFSYEGFLRQGGQNRIPVRFRTVLSLDRVTGERVAISEIGDRTLEQKLEQAAKYDGLTDILNQRGFKEKLETEMARARRTKANLALLLIDLDFFKKLNDTRGHNAGNEALVEVAKRLKVIGHRPSDVPVRQGGDEFAMILPNTDLAGAKKVALKILESLLVDKIPTGAGDTSLGASIGIAVFNGGGESAEDLKDRADKAVYAVKEAGRNGACFGPPSTEIKSSEWMIQGDTSIRKALGK